MCRYLWEYLPQNFPSWSTCRRRLLKWEEQGILLAIHQHLLALLDEAGKLRMEETFLDGTFVPAKKGGANVGKTKAGKGSMIMSVVDGNGTPLNTEVESTSTYKGHVAEKTVDGIKIKKQDKHHRKATRLVPVRVISDKDYDDDGLRETFAEKGIELIVPYRNNRVNRSYEDKRKLRRYCRRYKVERTNAWFKNCHRGAVRWDRCLTLYKGFSNSPVFVLL